MLADAPVGAHDQHAGLAAGRQQLQQIGQRDLLDAARHRLGRPAAGWRSPASCERASFSVSAGAPLAAPWRTSLMIDVPIRMRSPSLISDRANLLAVDEGAVGRAEVLDGDALVVGDDLGVLARDHVLDQHHVQLGRAPDDDLAVAAAAGTRRPGTCPR